MFDLTRTAQELYETCKYKTATDVFDCLEGLDDVEDIKKLRPTRRMKELLKHTAELAASEGRTWQVALALFAWGIGRYYVLAIMRAHKGTVPGLFKTVDEKQVPSVKTKNIKHILGFAIRANYGSLLYKDIEIILEHPT